MRDRIIDSLIVNRCHRYIIIIITLFRVSHTSVSRWFSTGVWVKANLLKYPDLLILIILVFGWSPLVLLFPSLPVPLSILWWLYQAHQFLLVSPPLSCSIVFFSSLARSRYLSFFLLYFSFTMWSAETAKSTIRQVLCFFVFCLLFFCFVFTVTLSSHLA